MSNPSYDPELFLALHRGTPGDAAFYRRVCRGAVSILELGCGDGRVLCRLAEPGRRVVGIDLSMAFLKLARQRRELTGATLLQEDMASFSLKARFDRVLIPFSGFFCLSPRKKRACLEVVRRHLTARGQLVLDVYDAEQLEPPARKGPEPKVDRFDWVGNVRSGEARYEVHESSRWWPSRQRLDVSYRYVPHDGGRARLGTIRHWYLPQEALLQLLREHGFDCSARSMGRRAAEAGQYAVSATPSGVRAGVKTRSARSA